MSSSCSGYVVQFSNGRDATTYSVATPTVGYDAASTLIRSSLMNLGHTAEAPLDSEYVAGRLDVERTATKNYHGYAWTLVFSDCADGDLNEGDLVPINVAESSASESLEFDVSELVAGAQSLGNAIYGDMADAQPAVNGAPPSVEGFVRLDFDGSAYSNYIHATSGIEYAKASYRICFNGEYFDDCLPYDASADDIRKALFGQTSGVQRTRYALRNVSVTRHLYIEFRYVSTRAPEAAGDAGVRIDRRGKGVRAASGDEFAHGRP